MGKRLLENLGDVVAEPSSTFYNPITILDCKGPKCKLHPSTYDEAKTKGPHCVEPLTASDDSGKLIVETGYSGIHQNNGCSAYEMFDIRYNSNQPGAFRFIYDYKTDATYLFRTPDSSVPSCEFEDFKMRLEGHLARGHELFDQIWIFLANHWIVSDGNLVEHETDRDRLEVIGSDLRSAGNEAKYIQRLKERGLDVRAPAGFQNYLVFNRLLSNHPDGSAILVTPAQLLRFIEEKTDPNSLERILCENC